MRARALVCVAVAMIGASAVAQSPFLPVPDELGLLINENPFKGYNLFSPLDAGGVYLIDNEGRVVNFWPGEYRTLSGYLLDDGTLVRGISLGNKGNKHFHGGGAGYGVQKVAWDGEVLWEFIYASEDYLTHHDIQPLPNGNVLMIAWEQKTVDEALAAGRDPNLLGEDGLWPCYVIEVNDTGKIVWEWHVWDHLVQDYDSSKENYGEVAAHPELIDINPPGLWMDRISEEEREELEALGYLGGAPEGDGGEETEEVDPRVKRARGADWLHTNAIAYNPELDQIVLSILGNSELWVIDHSTTTEEAAGHSGGRSGKGGDLLYRWGNPAAYRLGSEADQKLFVQHDTHWIPEGYPGAGNLLMFNNGRGRSDGDYSSVIEIAPPLKADGTYAWEPGTAFGPERPAWEYTAPEKKDFYSSFISGAQRLPNGNTLICQGANGTFFEVTPEKETVWKYVNPVVGPEGGSHRGENEMPTNAVFRVYRYAADHPALAGKDLSPGPLLTEYIKEHPPIAPLAHEDLMDRTDDGE